MATGDTLHHADEARPRRVACFRCRLYSREERRCRIGKVNPQTKLDTYEAVQVFGVRALCAFNLYREQLLSHLNVLSSAPSPSTRDVLPLRKGAPL
ncbi:MAG: hypothetical protein RMM06_07815 [Armatimonadota bacterium]|nr:hypothetical protein [Armatimonadota bacterium]MDW8104583.1 hypothetical protein [Armatimonadota bacterium]MDW8290615.1 hypothetical protein [Armatimonadota bacterium]